LWRGRGQPQEKRLIGLDLGALIAARNTAGNLRAPQSGAQEITKAQGRIVLFIDEIHTMVGAGKAEGAMDAGNMLKPMLARGELHCIGATTLDEYRKHIEKDAALERRFQPVMVNEPSVEDTISILRGLRERYELHHGVRIQDAALVAAAQLSNRYISDRFPDKAIDLIDGPRPSCAPNWSQCPKSWKVRTPLTQRDRTEALRKERMTPPKNVWRRCKEMAELGTARRSLAQWESESA
jgi:ATP-dependent Clp protease ATP-binding subunit ClpB